MLKELSWGCDMMIPFDPLGWTHFSLISAYNVAIHEFFFPHYVFSLLNQTVHAQVKVLLQL